MAARTIKNIGIIGLGRMGLPIAHRLMEGGYGLYGCDSTLTAADAARTAGIEILESAAKVAGASDATILLVGFETQVEDAVFGPDGVIAGARPGGVLMIASTVSPTYMKQLAGRAADAGMTVLDIPLAGGEMAAQKGDLLVYAGGDEAALELCRPVLECFAERIEYLGPAGAGQAAKAINNMLLWTCVTATAEGLDLGESLGIDRERLREALCHGSGANWALRTRADERPALWAEKDMELFLAEAAASGCATPVGQTVRNAIAAFKKARGLPTPGME